MIKKFFVAFVISAMAILAGACQRTEDSANANMKASNNDKATTSTAPDNSQVVTTTDRNGVKTETRIFNGNPRVSKVVVTTRDGNRTVKVYSPSGEERELKSGSTDPLTATGNAISEGAGFVVNKSETAADKTKEGTKTVVEKPGATAKTVGEKTVGTSKTIAEKTAAKTKSAGTTVADKTKEGTKKTGNAIKKVVTP